IEMPDLPEDEGTTKIGGTIIRDGTLFNEKEENLTNSIWEDEDARSFYESLIDLKTLVPGVLLEAKTGKKDDADVDKDDHTSIGQDKDDKDDKDDKEDDDKLSEGNQSDDNKHKATQDTIVETTDKIVLCNEDQEDKAELDGEKINIQADIDSPTIKKDNETSNKSGTSAQLDSLLSRLPNMVNRDLIDRAAVDFCYLNSKASRKKLIK
ncbi:2006_t:CDS:2, partial [Racocetra fulgida]